MKIDKNINKATRSLLTNIRDLAQQQNIQIFVVGGFVRDLLLTKEVKDIDFVVLGDALAFAREFKKTFKAHALVLYPKFGTTMLNYNSFKLEFVSARKEVYSEDSRNPKVMKSDLKSDLSRRDFTINTLAMDIRENHFGEILDLFNGGTDLADGIIKTPLDPVVTFSDDPLRMMRAIRFASRLDFSIDTGTFKAIKLTSDRLEIISQERITDEFNKILLSPRPSHGLRLLDECGLLQQFLPEFVATKGIEQRNEHHHKDVFYHTLQVLDQVAEKSDRLNLRLAALFHDIAKPRTKRFDEKNGWTFHGHEVVGERMVSAILHKLKYSSPIINYVKKIVRLHLRPMVLVNEDVTDSAIRRLLFLSGQEFDDLMLLCRADITSKNPRTVKRHLHNYEIVLAKAIDLEERDKLRAFKSPVSGSEIMTVFLLQPGPMVGKIKKFIEEAILEGTIPNDHDAALNLIIENKLNLLDIKPGI